MSRSIRNVNVCVVGGAGFLGSHLVNHLVEDRGCKVLVLDNLVTGLKKFIHPEAEFEHCDITGTETYIYRLLKEHRIQFLYNYAAMPYIPDSFERPLRVFDINARGALSVINAAEEAGCEAILQVSSAEIYGEVYGDKEGAGTDRHCVGESYSIDEMDTVKPHSSYGASKAAIDAMVQVRWRENKTPVISLRQFNCLGERETHPYVVPEIIQQITHSKETGPSGGPVIKLGNNSFRDFQYAGDAVRMATSLLERGQFGEVYNMGSEEGVKIYDLAHQIGRLMNWIARPICITVDPSRIRPWEIWHLQSDNTKLYEAIGRPATKVKLQDALYRTISYYQQNGCKWDWQ